MARRTASGFRHVAAWPRGDHMRAKGIRKRRVCVCACGTLAFDAASYRFWNKQRQRMFPGAEWFPSRRYADTAPHNTGTLNAIRLQPVLTGNWITPSSLVLAHNPCRLLAGCRVGFADGNGRENTIVASVIIHGASQSRPIDAIEPAPSAPLPLSAHGMTNKRHAFNLLRVRRRIQKIFAGHCRIIHDRGSRGDKP
ncbi:hypothetical protein KCP74_23070 [Salmonella enterica subsp. enterica]|nr:hypothetical protein KCP74_23070 [Salmonella enterica subsp. enterica]